MNGGARGKFVGRADALALLDESLTAARAGRPGVVVVEGEPGIGKTALLRQAVRLAPDASVVWASGDPVESGLEGGMARQLLAGWPAPERAAAGGDSLALGAALLAGIGAAEQQAPAVVVVVDDLHWADLASAQALLFCLRRLRADTVLILLAARPHSLERLGESCPPSCPVRRPDQGRSSETASGPGRELGTFPRDAEPPRPACWQSGEAA